MTFSKPTVFILGAGSSEKFPLGENLVREIIAGIEFSKNSNLHDLGISELDYVNFIKQLRFNDPNSIDVFLEENPYHIKIGRIAIAQNLIKKEDELQLFPPNSSPNNWYKTFVDELRISKYRTFSSNSVTIFTYNYERSLEHYLTKIIQHRMGVKEEDAKLIRNKIPIYYLHGSLGSLNEKDSNFRSYETKINVNTLRIASNSIRIISEQSDDYECQQQLRTALTNAENIFFFGFGFHPVNMKRLMRAGLREALSRQNVKVIAIKYNIANKIWGNIVKNQFEGLLNGRQPSSTIYDYLKENGFENY